MYENNSSTVFDYLKWIIYISLFLFLFSIFFRLFFKILLMIFCGCLDVFFEESLFYLVLYILLLLSYDVMMPFSLLFAGRGRKKSQNNADLILSNLNNSNTILRSDLELLVGLTGFELSNLLLYEVSKKVDFEMDIKSGHFIRKDHKMEFRDYASIDYCKNCNFHLKDDDLFQKKMNQLIAKDNDQLEELQIGGQKIFDSYMSQIEGNMITYLCISCNNKVFTCRICKTLVERNQNFCARCGLNTFTTTITK